MSIRASSNISAVAGCVGQLLDNQPCRCAPVYLHHHGHLPAEPLCLSLWVRPEPLLTTASASFLHTLHFPSLTAEAITIDGKDRKAGAEAVPPCPPRGATVKSSRSNMGKDQTRRQVLEGEIPEFHYGLSSWPCMYVRTVQRLNHAVIQSLPCRAPAPGSTKTCKFSSPRLPSSASRL